MQIGDAVIPKQDYCLVSGCNWYPGAIVVSLNPFVLVSTKGDMIWYKERPEDFDVIGQARSDIVARAQARWKGEPQKNT